MLFRGQTNARGVPVRQEKLANRLNELTMVSTRRLFEADNQRPPDCELFGKSGGYLLEYGLTGADPNGNRPIVGARSDGIDSMVE